MHRPTDRPLGLSFAEALHHVVIHPRTTAGGIDLERAVHVRQLQLERRRRRTSIVVSVLGLLRSC